MGPHKWVWWAGIVQMGEKKITFLTETLPKLRFLWWFHLFGHHATWRVGPAWGVRRTRIGWEKFSIVFGPYSIYKKGLLSLVNTRIMPMRWYGQHKFILCIWNHVSHIHEVPKFVTRMKIQIALQYISKNAAQQWRYIPNISKERSHEQDLQQANPRKWWTIMVNGTQCEKSTHNEIFIHM
jgi:hypothetical protein